MAAFAFSPGSQVLAVTGDAGEIRLVEPMSGREYVRLDAPDQTRLCPQCFTPDGSQLAVACNTQVVQLWDLGRIRRQLAAMPHDLYLVCIRACTSTTKTSI